MRPSQTGRERSWRVMIRLLTLPWGLTSSSSWVGVTCGSGWPAMNFLNFPPECLFVRVSLHIAGDTFWRVRHQTEGLHMGGRMNHGEITVWRCTANTEWHVFCLPGSPVYPPLEITKRKRTAQESIAKCHFLRCCMIYSVQPGVIKNECWSFQTPILKHQSIN